MDRVRFDALARLLAAGGSRRGVLAVLGGALAGGGYEAAAKKHKHKHKNKHKHQDTTCFGTLECEFPSDGKSFRDCNLSSTGIAKCNGCDFRGADLDTAWLADGSFQGASFREADLGSAFLDGADLSGASFRDACLVDADFYGANVDGADFRGAIFCNTYLPDGSIDNSGCGDTTDCCPPCLFQGDSCGDGIFGECCGGTVCNGETCVVECYKDSECGFDQICCANRCLFGSCCYDNQCAQNEQCVGLQCQCGNDDACSGSDTCCGAPDDDIPFHCVDTDTDPENCGDCLVACLGGEECIDGTCEVECEDDEDCPGGEICIDGFCVVD